jgi:hypothetical protein
MALHDRIALQADSIGNRAELNSAEFCTEHASRLLKPSLQQKSELLAKEKLQPKGIPKGMYRKQFPDTPLALQPFQFPLGTSCKADHKRPSVNEVSFCVIEDEWADRQA